jgi:thiamine biosynthesis lipoprotein
MLEKSHQLFEHGHMDRRNFLKASGIIGVGLATCSMGLPLTEAIAFDKELYRVSKSKTGMGTMVSITVLNPSKDHAEEAIYIAFDEIDRLAELMDWHDPATPLARLNKEGFLKDPPPELALVIKNSIQYHQRTGGLFDITIKPVLDYFSQSLEGPTKIKPDNKKIAGLLKLVDAKLIALGDKTISLRKNGMGITLDGIAKGYIIDKAAEKLIGQGIRHALINAGGDIRTIGDKGDSKPWTIAIEDPLKQKDYPDVIAITNKSIATSGNYEVFFDREKVFHHIINPKTGLSPIINASVSVKAPTAMEADALSTTLFVTEPGQGGRLINSFAGCDSLIVTKNKQKIKSAGWESIRA